MCQEIGSVNLQHLEHKYYNWWNVVWTINNLKKTSVQNITQRSYTKEISALFWSFFSEHQYRNYGLLDTGMEK